MSYSKRSRYSYSPSPDGRYSRHVSRSLSRSRSISRSRSRSRDSIDVDNPGNNLYVTGLSARVTKGDLEKHFSAEGTVEDVQLVMDPWTRESRGFGFVTMATVKEADRCIKYLDRSVLGGRVITVEKARRRRGRTPTPGRYLGLRKIRARRRSGSYSSYSRSRSPRYSPECYRSRSRSYSPYYSRRRRSYSPYYSHRRSYSRSPSPYSRSPVTRRDRDRSYSPYYCDYLSDEDRYYRSCRRIRRRSVSVSPPRYYQRRRSYSRSISPRRRRRSYSSSVSPPLRRSSGRMRRRRSYSRSVSPVQRRSLKKGGSRGRSMESYCSGSYLRGRSVSASSRSFSRSLTPRSDSPSH